MQSFREYVKEQQGVEQFDESRDLLTPKEIDAIRKHYGGNSGTDKIVHDLEDYEGHVKILNTSPGKADKGYIAKQAKQLRKIGKEDGVI